MKKRAYIFVDGGFLYKSIKEAYGGIKYDLKKVCDLITGNRNLVGISYYVGEIDTHMGKTKKEKEGYKALRIKQQKFLSKLKEMGIEYRLGYFNKNETQEKSVDMLLATDMIGKGLDDVYDVAIIITGDGDFLPAIELIQKRLKKKVLNGAFKKRYSVKLLDRCDGFFFVNDKIKKSSINNRES